MHERETLLLGNNVIDKKDILQQNCNFDDHIYPNDTRYSEIYTSGSNLRQYCKKRIEGVAMNKKLFENIV